MTRFIANLNQYQNKEAEWFSWQNGASSAVPAYGVVRFSAFSTVHTAVKPDGAEGLYYVNGPVEQPVSAYSASASWIRSQPVMFEPGASVSVGDACGPISGQWYMGTSGTGWRVFVPPNSDNIAFVKKDAGGEGSVERIIEGTVQDNDCPAGTVDLSVKFCTDKTDCSQVHRIEDYFGVMAGHTAAQLVGAKALAGYVWDCTLEEWVWHLWLLAGLDECTGLP